jgi:hypothetical protein
MSERAPEEILWDFLRGAMTTNGGRERTEDEWQALLEGAGLEPVAIGDGLVEARCE